ncbi:MAG: ATP-binding protein [Magnetovibrio sp.]|nr:ATP-binding protein [Magnetovibrio sp.]
MYFSRIKDIFFLRQFSGSIARQLTAVLVLFGIGATLITTAAQTYREYQVELKLIEARVQSIRAGHGPSLAASVWDIADEKIIVELQGLLNIPGLQYAEVATLEGETWSVGQRNSSAMIRYEIPLMIFKIGQNQNLGNLIIEIEQKTAFQRVLSHALESFIYYALWTVVLAGSLFWIIRHLVTRHLSKLADYTSTLSLDVDAKDLVLDRPSTNGQTEDELTKVVNAINFMRSELATSIHELSDHRDRLQDLVQERTKELAAALEAAEQASEAKSTFLASMSHELHTPLNAIIGFSSTMKAETYGPLGNEKYSDYTADILASGEHLLELINDILDVSEIEAGKVDLLEERVSLPGVIQSVIHLIQIKAKEGGVVLKADIPKDLPLLLADERRVKQILLNLVSNGVKFTRPGGSVSVMAEAAENGRGIALTVTDTGVGMEPHEIDWAMSQFGQLDNGLNRKPEGTGLGLPLARGLMELHQGKLDVKSKKGIGTTVIATFPKNRIIELTSSDLRKMTKH